METRHIPDTGCVPEHGIELKRDAFGTIRYEARHNCIVRVTSDARPWLRGLARRLARREARALRRIAGAATCPRLLEESRDRLRRSYLDGKPLYAVDFAPRAWFRDALRQLRRMHACAIAHNDLAKEANWICMPGSRAGIVDFQLACCFSRHTRLFRALAREDLRHLLKHKQHYAAELLTQRQRAILARPSWAARVWRRAFKPVYLLVTRRILHWHERDSAIERTI